MKQLDYTLGCAYLGIKMNNLIDASIFLKERINSNEKDVARCKPISEEESNKIIQSYNFNIGTALKHIFAFTRTIKKGNRPNKAELKLALKYIEKEMERSSNEQN
jgi:hypothetical protein